MKRYTILILLLLIAGLAVFFSLRPGHDHWYGSFQIGDDHTLISIIAVGHDVFYDANSDGIPQRDELVDSNQKIKIISGIGGAEFTLKNVRVALVPQAASSEFPQLTDVEIQSNQHPCISQMGTVTMALNRDTAETCNLLGPLSFLLMPQDLELTAGNLNELKISIGTISSSNSGTTAALLYTSAVGDREKYAFGDSERPKLKIWFGDQTQAPQELIFDGFC